MSFNYYEIYIAEVLAEIFIEYLVLLKLYVSQIWW